MSGNEASNTSTRLIIVGIVWLIATVIAEVIIASTVFNPFAASREATITDDAFNLLMVLSAPVFTFVLVMGGYSLIRDRSHGSDDDGAPIRSNKVFVWTWLLITTALSIVIIITPGFTGLNELAAEPDADLVIDVRGEQWNWAYTYADSGVQTQGNLVLPIDTRIKFRITATDVIHSFWIPAFRIKQDAVPGKVTETLVTPEVLGSFETSEQMRVQCADLCGVGHARMWTGVEVVEQAEFEEWLAARGG